MCLFEEEPIIFHFTKSKKLGNYDDLLLNLQHYRLNLTSLNPHDMGCEVLCILVFNQLFVVIDKRF